MSLPVPTPVYTNTVAGCPPSIPVPGSSSHQTAKSGTRSQLSGALFSPKRLHSSLLFLLFQQSPMTLIAHLNSNKIASYQGFKK